MPLEPRLAKKLQDPLCEMVEVREPPRTARALLHHTAQVTPAKSLQYECLNTLLSGEVVDKNVVQVGACAR